MIYRLGGIDPRADQRWTIYLASLLGFSFASILFLFAFLKLQGSLPLSLEPEPSAPRYLITEPGIGYRFVAG